MKLVTWNTQWCCGLDGRVSAARIVEGARAMADFDVLCLQEIADGFTGLAGAPGAQPAELQALLPGFQLFFGAAVDKFNAAGQRQRFGNLIATRLPVVQVAHHPLPWPVDTGMRSMPRLCSVVTVRDPQLGRVRVMTAHLEYYSLPQRAAQAGALRQLHIEATAHACAPPRDEADDGSPFHSPGHARHAILCGDFNLPPSAPEYAMIQQPFHLPQTAGHSHSLQDGWRVLHGEQAHAPTAHVYDRRYGPEPVACDFVFVSDSLAPHLRRIKVDLQTQASDHQPVLAVFGA